MTTAAPISITIIISLAAILTIIILLVRKKKRSAEKKLEKAERKLLSEEKDLIDLFKEKKGEVHKLRQRFTKKTVTEIKRIIEEQKDLLHTITQVGDRELKYLKAIGMEYEAKGGRMHVSRFVKDIEKEWDLSTQENREAKLDEIHSDPDALSRAIKYLVVTLFYLHRQFVTIREKLKEQKRLVEKDNKIMELERSLEKEEAEIETLMDNTVRMRKYLRQLEDAEAAEMMKKGPFFSVEGHSVSVVVDPDSRATRTFGRDERIPLYALPEKFAIGSDPHDCIIVAGGDVSPVHALLIKRGAGFYLKTATGVKGMMIERKKEKIFVSRPMKLRHRDKVILTKGYEFRFLES